MKEQRKRQEEMRPSVRGFTSELATTSQQSTADCLGLQDIFSKFYKTDAASASLQCGRVWKQFHLWLLLISQLTPVPVHSVRPRRNVIKSAKDNERERNLE